MDYILTDKKQTYKTNGTFSWDKITAILQNLGENKKHEWEVVRR